MAIAGRRLLGVALLAVALLAVALLAGLVAAVGSPVLTGQAAASPAGATVHGVGAAPAGTGLVTVLVDQRKQTAYKRTYFLGLSFSSHELYDNQFVDKGNLPALLENLGRGILRFGGNSVDMPSYTGITQSAANGLAGLVKATRWQVIYTVNLGHFNAGRVTADARRVVTALGSSLVSIACGNEPELFYRNYRPANYNETQYLSKDVPPCLRAVHAGAPGVPFSGPNTFRVNGGPGHWVTPWLTPYAQAAAAGKIPGLKWIAAQFYPLTHCGNKTPPPSTLLSTAVEEKEKGVLANYRATEAYDHLRYIVAETNSASCGGITGLSNTYASALWVADWLMLAAERNAKNVALNGSLFANCVSYSPLCGTSPGMYAPRPVYYGMLFTQMLGSGSTYFIPTTISGTTGAHVVTHSVLSRKDGFLRVMVENLGGSPVNVLLKDSHVSGTAFSWYLTGPSLGATTGVKIQGATVGSNGTFRPGNPGRVTCQSGSCRLSLPAYSAVIVRLPK